MTSATTQSPAPRSTRPAPRPRRRRTALAATLVGVGLGAVALAGCGAARFASDSSSDYSSDSSSDPASGAGTPVAASATGMPPATSTRLATMTTTTAPGPTLGTLPQGFVPTAVAGRSCPAGGCAGGVATVASWAGPERLLDGAGSPAESLELDLGTGAVAPVPGITESVRVRGHDGVIARLDCHGGPGCTTIVTVQWAEDATHWVQVQYDGPLPGSSTGDPLTTAQLVQVADGYRPSASGAGDPSDPSDPTDPTPRG